MAAPISLEDLLVIINTRQEELGKKIKTKRSDIELVKLSGRIDELSWVLGEINGH